MFSENDNVWMQHALQLAEKAAAHQEVPVGAVLVLDNKLIGEGWNKPISSCDPSAHAEVVALREGAQTVQNYRLVQSTLYVTLEPCLMCLGAIIHARVQRLVFGAYDLKSGAVESVFQLAETDMLNHRVVCQGGLFAERCGLLLKDFFRARR